MEFSKKIKKGIAKEILIFFSGALIWGILITIIYGYNFYENHARQKLINQEKGNRSKIDSLYEWVEVPIDNTDLSIYGFVPDSEPTKSTKGWVPPSDAVEVRKKVQGVSSFEEGEKVGQKHHDSFIPDTPLKSIKIPTHQEDLLPPPPPYKDFIRKDSIQKALRLENAKKNKELANHHTIVDMEYAMRIIAFGLLCSLYLLRFIALIIWWAFKTVLEGNDS